MSDFTTSPAPRASGRVHFAQIAAATAPTGFVSRQRDPLRRPQPTDQPNGATPDDPQRPRRDKSYRKGPLEIPVLQGVDLAVGEGEFVAIIGPSGCGKSTLLHLLATLDVPDYGEVYFEGNRIDNLAAAGRDILRNRYFGMIFQFYHLLPELTMLENVLAPAMIGQSVLGYWCKRRQYRERARECSASSASAIA